tara:strand:+ start:18 stop:602 length:585 start_codon:yes stop_codon:yes gene_type:complete
MSKKTVIQIFLIILIFLISLSFYLKYFNNKPKTLKDSSLEKKNATNQNNTSTYIDKVNYVSSDTEGNRYQITAEKAKISNKDSNVMFLNNVIAYIFIKDSETIRITSDFGEYNSKNYDTIFSKNVIIIYPSHKITGEYLNFSYLKNVGTISTNVIYSSDEINLFADKIVMNLLSKDVKIFMNDINEKVLIEGTK